MIRALWIFLATLAIANVFALAILFGWLGSSGRLSGERVRAVTAMFSETLAEEAERRDAESDDAERAAALAEEEAKVGRPPVTAEQRMEIIREYSDQIAQRTERTQRATEDLIRTLMAQQARLRTEREAFEAERDAFDAMRRELVELEGSEQFAKSLKIYETVKAPVAASMLGELIGSGETDQVIAYLDAMKSRTASKIVTELERQSPALAAELLERLRVHGMVAVAPGDTTE